MLKDQSPLLSNAELSVPSKHSIDVLLQFVDDKIDGFRAYIFSVDKVEDENAITFHLANFFNSHVIAEKEGFLPYQFSFVKNPPQTTSRRETDLGVVILSKSHPSFTIIEFEAKRLSSSSNNSEYVQGDRGGIERFKRKFHAGRLETCGIFGYVQIDNSTDWVGKINQWINELAKKESKELDWTNKDELLSHVTSFGSVEKWSSITRRTDDSKLRLFHYFIDLKNANT